MLWQEKGEKPRDAWQQGRSEAHGHRQQPAPDTSQAQIPPGDAPAVGRGGVRAARRRAASRAQRALLHKHKSLAFVHRNSGQTWPDTLSLRVWSPAPGSR